MKYILLTVCLLVGCAKQEEADYFTPSRPVSQPAAVTSEVPVEVQAAIAVLTGDRKDEAKVKQAIQAIFASEPSVVVSEETLQNTKTGEYSKEVTHRFPKSGINLIFRDGVVISPAPSKQ
jgi:hypothetical protein